MFKIYYEIFIPLKNAAKYMLKGDRRAASACLRFVFPFLRR